MLSKLSDTSLNAYYYSLKTDRLDHESWKNVTLSKALKAVPGPRIQALNPTAENRPPVPDTNKNSTIYRDYEYVRLGTLSLLAAIDLLTGKPFR